MVKNAYAKIPDTKLFWFLNYNLGESLDKLDFSKLSAEFINQLAKNKIFINRL